MKFFFIYTPLLLLIFLNQSFANSKGRMLFEEMEKDYTDMKVRSWLPTSMAGRGSKGSAFYQWVIGSKNKQDIEKGIQKEGRILIRKSGTEDLIRLMVEHNDQIKLEETLESCLNVLKK